MRMEDGAKRVRVVLGGTVVADTLRPKLVWEVPYYPMYWLPEVDARLDAVPGEVMRRGGTGDEAALAGYVRFEWEAMDHWFEEDEEIFVHPRDPYSRVDILASSRHVLVRIGGVVVGESRQPRLLFETGLPTRYYLPLTDVRLDLLRPSESVTRCPYKGTAAYWSVEVDGKVHEDVAWTYRAPLAESQKIAGLVAFYNDRVDLTVDGRAA